MHDAPPLDLEAAYREHRPLLLGVLSRMVRSGQSIPFGDGIDIVHDFFVEQYPRVVQTYDPGRGSFSTYLYAAFSRFARARAIRMSRMASLLPATMAPPATELGMDSARHIDLGRLDEAMAALEPEVRDLLRARFADDRSEREIAVRLAVSRHETRERILSALARLMVAMGERRAFTEREWEVARLLWVEQRSIADIAATLGLSPARVKRARDRVVHDIAGSFDRQGSLR